MTLIKTLLLTMLVVVSSESHTSEENSSMHRCETSSTQEQTTEDILNRVK